MNTAWLALGISAAGVVLAYFTAIRSARRQSSEALAREISDVRDETLERVSEKLDTIQSHVTDVSARVNAMQTDITELKVTVAIHNDRFQRPLRAVGNDRP